VTDKDNDESAFGAQLAAGDNPAQRLLDLFRLAIGWEESGASEPAAVTWKAIFGVATDSELFLRAAQTYDLGNATRASILALADKVNSSLVLQYHDHVEATLSNFFHMSDIALESFMKPLSRESRYGLEHAADALHRFAPEPTLTHGTVVGLRERVRALIDLARNDETLDPDTRAWLDVQLRKIYDALQAVRIIGQPGVEAATNEFVGSLRRSPVQRLVNLIKSPTATAVVSLVTALNTALGTGFAGYAALAPADDHQETVIIQLEEQTGGHYAPRQLPPALPNGPATMKPAGVLEPVQESE
jgi:hypothetical protein